MITVDSEESNKMLLKKVCQVVAEVSLLSGRTAPMNQVVPPEISAMLENYSNVFKEPKSFPPARDGDHVIPLVPRAQPFFSLRPYRYSFDQRMLLKLCLKRCCRNKLSLPVSPLLLHLRC